MKMSNPLPALFFCIVIIMTSISCSEQFIVSEVVPTDDPIYFLALGDSYTIGQGVPEEDRWPNQLTERLEESGSEISGTQIIAQTGWTTSNLLSALNNEDLTALGDSNLVSLLIGVNNQFQGLSFKDFTCEFEYLLEKSIGYAGTKDLVFVVSIPDYGVTPFGSNNSEMIAEELDMYNDHMKSKCESFEIPFIDITEISRELGDSEDALAPDNLHPSGFQYREWVEEMIPVVIALLDN